MQLNPPSLLEAFPTINFSSPPKSWWILGAHRYCTMEENRGEGANGRNGFGFDAFEKVGKHIFTLSEGLVV